MVYEYSVRKLDFHTGKIILVDNITVSLNDLITNMSFDCWISPIHRTITYIKR